MSAAGTKECPFCAETIKAAAVLCRFCGRDLPACDTGDANAPSSDGVRSALSKIDRSEISDLLTTLVEKSLVIYEEDTGGRGRYRLLETVRQYGRNWLLESQEGESIRDRHLAFAVGLAEEAERQLRGREQREWLARLETEHDNCRVALEWSQRGDGAVEAALRLPAALCPFWRIRSYHREGREWLESALRLDAAPAGIPQEARRSWRAKALVGAGWMVLIQGDLTAAVTYLEEGCREAEETGDPWHLLNAHSTLAYALASMGKTEQASFHATESLAVSRKLDDRWALGRAQFVWGMTLLYMRDYLKSVEYFAGALASFREAGDQYYIAFSLFLMAVSAYYLGDLKNVEAWQNEAQAEFETLDSSFGLAWVAWMRGACASDGGDPRSARTLWEESLRRFQALGEWRGRAFALHSLAYLAERAGDYSRAVAYYRESLGLFQERDNGAGVAWALAGLASLATEAGSHARAARIFGAAEAPSANTELPLFHAARANYDRSVAATRATLGEEAFAAAWEEGRAMPLSQAIVYALEPEAHA